MASAAANGITEIPREQSDGMATMPSGYRKLWERTMPEWRRRILPVKVNSPLSIAMLICWDWYCSDASSKAAFYGNERYLN